MYDIWCSTVVGLTARVSQDSLCPAGGVPYHNRCHSYCQQGRTYTTTFVCFGRQKCCVSIVQGVISCTVKTSSDFATATVCFFPIEHVFKTLRLAFLGTSVSFSHDCKCHPLRCCKRGVTSAFNTVGSTPDTCGSESPLLASSRELSSNPL